MTKRDAKRVAGPAHAGPDQELSDRLARATAVMEGAVGEPSSPGRGVGVDLGTAFTVLVVIDGNGEALAGDHRYGSVTRDGVVVDYHGAVRTLRELKEVVEGRLGCELTKAASGFPPGVAESEVRAVVHVMEAAGLECSALIDEPTAANAVLGVRDGAVVDVGGGTTGIAVFSGGELVCTADEPTGGTQASLVISGRFGIPFDEAERWKRDPARQADLAPVLRPVWEKVATIVARAIAPYDPPAISLVGGTSRFPGIADVIASVTGVPTALPGDPMFVTALGFAHHDMSATGALR